MTISWDSCEQNIYLLSKCAMRLSIFTMSKDRMRERDGNSREADHNLSSKSNSSLIIRIAIWAWWCLPMISELGRLKQEDGEFKVSLGCWEILSQTMVTTERWQ